MGKYRIRVESMDHAEELRAEYRMGIECDAFVILGEREDGMSVSIHKLSTVDIAGLLAKSPNMLSAAIIAKAMAEAKRYEREADAGKMMEAIFGRARKEDDE